MISRPVDGLHYCGLSRCPVEDGAVERGQRFCACFIPSGRLLILEATC
jgi:hypothetical protein